MVHRAQWEKHGKSAGVIRNKVLVDDCDKVVVFWDGESPGTKNVISVASKASKLLRVFRAGNPKQMSLF